MENAFFFYTFFPFKKLNYIDSIKFTCHQYEISTLRSTPSNREEVAGGGGDQPDGSGDGRHQGGGHDGGGGGGG